MRRLFASLEYLHAQAEGVGVHALVDDFALAPGREGASGDDEDRVVALLGGALGWRAHRVKDDPATGRRLLRTRRPGSALRLAPRAGAG